MASDLGFSFEMGAIEVAIDGSLTSIRPELPTKYLAPLAPFAAPSWMEHVLAYLLSPAGNTPTHLAWVVWVIFAVLLVRAALVMHRIETARRRIPLTIGGWGTRGKSGCERLKAALFHALRYDVVVKTTGCEAMFIHAMRDMPAQEIFLYRPYDKATIWEQKATLHTAERLGAQVFLWECMALQPRFVDTLQNEWMRDPITTLTNAYPDHEDIQGPSGEDVARVIGRFMPEGGRTFTTEEQMIPLLRDAAKTKGTELIEISPIEADLLPADLLARLPYNEHPRNVALILELAEALGIDREFALVEMADYVVPDLGVLKTYPTARYRGRALTFSNGMSANERAGFLSNWTRLDFDKRDQDKTPGVNSVVILNNRADRVARSRVFAKIVVEDIGVDLIVLINSNLGGMLQFIEEALDLRLRSTSITGEGGLERALERLDAALLKIGVPSRADALLDGLSRMLGALPLSSEQVGSIFADPAIKSALQEPKGAIGPALERALSTFAPPEGQGDIRPEIILHGERLADRIARRDAVRAEVRAAFEQGAPEKADEAFRKAYKSLFMDRIHVLWNADATGDQVIDFIAREVPPGSDARLMGAQNIKGTGLDFVYRWLSLDRVRASIARMKSDASSRARELSWMLGYSDYGLLDCREALAFIEDVRKSGDWAPHAPILEGVSRRLTSLVREKEAKLTATGKTGLAVEILGRLEQLIDHLDSMRRSTDASRIMNDLYAKRIGHGRAALLMRGVVARTKGGWLAKDVMAFITRLQRGREAPRELKDGPKAPALPR
jgi:poly-gamma-glutamate synthase PgsB/CapB